MPSNPIRATERNLMQRRMTNIASEFRKADPSIRRKGNVIFKVIGGYYVFMILSQSSLKFGYRTAYFQCQPLFGPSTGRMTLNLDRRVEVIDGHYDFPLLALEEECFKNQRLLHEKFLLYCSQFQVERDCYEYCMRNFGSNWACTFVKLAGCIWVNESHLARGLIETMEEQSAKEIQDFPHRYESVYSLFGDLLFNGRDSALQILKSRYEEHLAYLRKR